MKRILSVLLAMTLLLGIGGASAVSVDLHYGAEDSSFSYFSTSAVVGNDLWIIRHSDEVALVRVPTDGSAPETITQTASGKKLSLNSFGGSDSTKEQDGEHNLSALMGGDRLLGLDSGSGKVWEITVKDGKADFTDVTTIQPADGLLYNEVTGDSLVVNNSFLFVDQNTLYIGGYVWNEGSSEQFNYAVSLTDGSVKRLAVTDLYRLAPYKDGKLLATVHDPSNSWDEATKSRIPGKLGVYDPATDQFEQKGELKEGDAKLVYVPKLDAPVYFDGGKLMMLQDWKTPKQVGFLPGSYSDHLIVLADGSIAGGDTNQGVITVRDVSADFSTDRKLVVFQSGMDDGARAFMKKHPDVPVYFLSGGGDTIEELAQMMVSGDNSFDIMSMNISYSAFQEMMAKGYCEDLSAYPALKAAAERMYAPFRDAVTLDGKLFAMPVQTYSQGEWGINKSVMEELGLTRDEIPTNLVDLCQFITRWNNEIGSDNPDYRLIDGMDPSESMKEIMLGLAMDMRQVECLKKGEELRFDTPEFRQVMQAIEAMDAREIDRERERDSEGEDEEYHEALLLTYYGMDWSSATAGGNEYHYALPMRLTADSEPIYGMDLEIYVINPRSANKELAAEFIADKIDTLQTTLRAELMADVNEPVENPDYERTLARIEKEIAEAEASLSKATDEQEKQEIEDNIRSTKEWRENHIKNNRYSVTQAMLDYYKTNYVPYMVVRQRNIFAYGKQGSEEVKTLRDRYSAGQISADQLLKELDNKLRMMRLENQ